MMPAQFTIDLFEELRELLGAFEPLVLEGSVAELTGLASKMGRGAAAARYGLMVADRCMTVYPETDAGKQVDEQVIAYAHRNRCLVVTNDRDLRNALLARGIGVISLRKQKRLELIQS